MESFSPGHLHVITTKLYAKHKITHLPEISEGFIPDAVLGSGRRI